MNLLELKLHNLGIDKDKFGKIYGFVDFGNVNYWFDKDRYDTEGNLLQKENRLVIDIEKLGNFMSLFCEKQLFYYGFDSHRKKSWHIHKKAENSGFVKVTKPIQFIRRYLNDEELEKVESVNMLAEDLGGKFIKIPKSNFDVEIKEQADLYINAQQIKANIVMVKKFRNQKTPLF